MPNWCMNDILIQGPIHKIEKLYNKIEKTGGLFEVMVPIGDWDYNTALDKWGVKWDASPENLALEEDGDEASISGTIDTAWGPPIQVFETFSNENPDVNVEIRYYEPGMCFVGWYIDNEDECYDYDPNDIESIKFIPEDLVDHFNLYSEISIYDDDDDED